MRAGSTTIAKMMSRHPDVWMPSNEIHYFSNERIYNKGILWYSDIFEKAPPKKMLGEKSATYHSYYGTAERMHKALPSARIIWVLRDPVKRLYSHYWHAVKNGAEKLSLEKAIKQDWVRQQRNPAHAYLHRSNYYEQVKEYLKYYPLNQMHFVVMEEYNSNRQDVSSGVFDYLGLKDYVISEAEERLHVTRRTLFSPMFQYWLREILGKENKVTKIVRKVNLAVGPALPPMDIDTVSKLNTYYRIPNDNLRLLIKRDMPFPWGSEIII